MGLLDSLIEILNGLFIVEIFEAIESLIPRPKIPVSSTPYVCATLGYFGLLAYIFKTGLYNNRLLLIAISIPFGLVPALITALVSVCYVFDLKECLFIKVSSTIFTLIKSGIIGWFFFVLNAFIIVPKFSSIANIFWSVVGVMICTIVLLFFWLFSSILLDCSASVESITSHLYPNIATLFLKSFKSLP